MKPTDNIHKLFKKLQVAPGAEMDRRVHSRITKALEEWEETKAVSPKPGIWKMILKSRTTRLAAAVVIVTAIVIGINYFGGSFGLTSSAFANVAEQLRTARTLTCTIIAKPPDTPTMRMEMSFKEPGHIRITGVGDFVSIIDIRQKKGLSINPLKKEFEEIDFDSLPAEQSQIDLIEKLRTLPDRADEVLEVEEIEGRMLQGFRVVEEGMDKIVWVDAKTSELTRVEIEFTNAPGMSAVMRNFQFNVNLDDSLFSLIPPEGYRHRKIELDASELNDEDLVKMLRCWVRQTRNNLFPPTLNPTELFKSVIEMKKAGKLVWKSGDITREEGIRQAVQINRGMMFVMQMEPDNDWHYAGKDVKFGDAETAIFWYRPKGSQIYRVIYGDLTTKNVAPEKLPR